MIVGTRVRRRPGETSLDERADRAAGPEIESEVENDPFRTRFTRSH